MTVIPYQSQFYSSYFAIHHLITYCFFSFVQQQMNYTSTLQCATNSIDTHTRIRGFSRTPANKFKDFQGPVATLLLDRKTKKNCHFQADNSNS